MPRTAPARALRAAALAAVLAAACASSASAAPALTNVTLNASTQDGVSDLGSNDNALSTSHGAFFFSYNDASNSTSLQYTTGVVGHTTTIRTVGPTFRLSDLTVVGDNAYFVSYDPASGNELWTSDGTTAGTHLVADLTPGTGSSDFGQHVAFGDKLAFLANDKLYVTDGTASGTHQISTFVGQQAFSELAVAGDAPEPPVQVERRPRAVDTATPEGVWTDDDRMTG